MTITVLTSITGGKDELVNSQEKGNALFKAFVDTDIASPTWQTKHAYDRFTDSRRNSRIHKILAHNYCDTEYSIWIDGNLSLLKPPEELIQRYLKDHDIAVFRHPNRNCIYEEAKVCADMGIEDRATLEKQTTQYKKKGYVEQKGLCECGVILRRNTRKVEAFNAMWWAEYCTHSKRDQISFMYAVERSGIRVNIITEPWIKVGDRVFRSDFIEYFNHKTPRT